MCCMCIEMYTKGSVEIQRGLLFSDHNGYYNIKNFLNTCSDVPQNDTPQSGNGRSMILKKKIGRWKILGKELCS